MPCTRPSRVRSRDGFTLAELLIVCFIIAIMAAMAGPRFANWIRTLSTRGAADQMAADLSLARVQAVRNGQTVSIRIDDADTYRVTLDDAGGNVTRTIKSVDVADRHPGTTLTPTSGRIAFDSRGILRTDVTTTQQLTITRGSRTRDIEITGVGRIVREY